MALPQMAEQSRITVELGELAYYGRATPHTHLVFDEQFRCWTLVGQPHKAGRGGGGKKWRHKSLAIGAGVVVTMLTLALYGQFKSTTTHSQTAAPHEVSMFAMSPPRLDKLHAIQDPQTVVVFNSNGALMAVREGEKLPTGAMLLKVNTDQGTAQTDHGLLTME
jgi:hypothetical protein